MKPVKMFCFKSLLVGVLISSIPLFAQAKTPPEVLKSYKEYRTALQAGDEAAARSAAKKAWQLAEESVGESKLTGDLAYNYANNIRGDVEDDQLEAMDRSMALAKWYGEDAKIIFLERGIRKLALLNVLGKNSKRLRESKTMLDFAEENGLENTTFAAEAMTILAGEYSAKGRNRQAAELSERALKVFAAADDGIQSAYPIQANLYRGYAYEAQENHMQAALSYQSVMEATDGLDPELYPLVGTALGRWIHMRGSLRIAGDLEDAEQAGLCQCWPYDKPRNEDVTPIKRTPPVMPRGAMQSGYVIVEFDLTDEGKPTNERVITSWPEYFEKPALKAISEWEYSPRTAEQKNEDRTDVIVTIRFQLRDSKGRPIW